MPKPRPQPTMKVGEPFAVPQVAIPEPAALIGLTTGKQYAVMGDNPNGPEMISQPQDGALQVIPPGGGAARRPTMGTPGGGVSMAGGGLLAFDPNTRLKRATLANEGLGYDEDIQLNEAQLGRIPQRRQLYGLQRAQLAQEQAVTGRRRTATLGAIQAATDVADQARVAQQLQARSSTDDRYRAAGVALPTEIEQATGDTSQIASPFARPKLMTRAQQIERDERNTRALEELDLSAGRQALEGARADYEEGGLALDEQRLGSEIASKRRRRAILGLEEDTLPPFQGAQLYTNPDGTQEWLTPGEADQRKYDYEFDLQNKRFPQQAQRQIDQQRQRDILQRQSYGLGGLTPNEALEHIKNGTLDQAGLTKDQVYKALQQQGYSPKAADALVANSIPGANKKAEDVFADFTENDFAQYLWGAVGREYALRRAQVEAYLIKTSGATAARVRLERYEAAVRALQEKKDKESNGGTLYR